ncbi:Flagellar biosynthesis protein FlhA OS=Ureibacillus acetophenoni OX=614649 GN=flhA PE=3 SV=1 [Ureibacillus acetophenoni]
MKFRDLGVLAVVILIVAMSSAIPLPTWLLSFLIIINITISLLILLTAMNMKEALDFAIFPSVILLVTLFRLGLSISTTRAILANGDAGDVVETFGEFVTGGNVLVGLVIFMLLVIVNFIVITKGSERVALLVVILALDYMQCQGNR